MGELVVDLRDTDLPAGDVPLEIDLGVGEARLILPDEDICTATTAEIGMGNVHFYGRDNGGIDIDFSEEPEAGPDITRLVIDARIGVGELRVEGNGVGGSPASANGLCSGARASG
jgi:hypothetical protein